MSEHQNVIIEFEKTQEVYKAMKPLKRKGYLKGCCDKISKGTDNKSIFVSGTSIEDVTHAMKIYTRNTHGTPVKYKIKSFDISQEEKIRKELEKDFELRDKKRIEEKQKLEEKFSKDRSKFQKDITDMRQEIEALENKAEYFEMLFENSQEDIKQEKRDYQELKIKLDDTYSELEETKKELKYEKLPFYKKWFDKPK